MNTVNQEHILTDVLNLLKDLSRDWEYSGEITPDTLIFADLGFESIDAVILASFVQKHYGRPFPFPQLLAEIGQRDTKDLRISELVGFIHQHLNGAAAAGAHS
uniref:Putative acyl carrier protein n=1 Tax=Solibacter usitatus (strain Ellin6076) TaxID=234267 RepID=Q026V5_SOLUE